MDDRLFEIVHKRAVFEGDRLHLDWRTYEYEMNELAKQALEIFKTLKSPDEWDLELKDWAENRRW